MASLVLVFICATCLLFSCVVHSAPESTDWCLDQHEHLDTFDEVKSFLNTSRETLTANELQDVISGSFRRVSCDLNVFAGGVNCSTCLNAGNVYAVLKLETTEELDKYQFERACAIILTYLHQLPAKCNQSSITNWDDLYYSNFTDELLDSDHDGPHDDDHGDDDDHDGEEFFTFGQLETLLRELNETHRPGELTVGAGGVVVEPNNSAVCADKDIQKFRARDILENTETHAPAEGFESDELGDMSANIIARLLRGDCMERDRWADDGLPDEREFLLSLFQQHGDNQTCRIYDRGFQNILAHLSIGTGAANTIPSDDGHIHAVDSRMLSAAAGDRDSSPVPNAIKRSREKRSPSEAGDLPAGVTNIKYQCMTGADILKTFYVNATFPGLSRDDVIRLSPALLQQATEGCVPRLDDVTKEIPSAWQTYGYGTLAVLVVSLCAPLGLVIYRARKSSVYAYLMTLMLGLAMGTLAGDALLHLLPGSLGIHGHDQEDHAEGHEEGFVIQPFVWKMVCACVSIWAFFALQMLLQYMDTSKGSGQNTDIPNGGIENLSYSEVEVGDEKIPKANGDVVSAAVKQKHTSTTSSEHDTVRAPGSVGWMIAIGDGVHNFADGLAIGAAFTGDWRMGLTTTIAVFFHELPHEFGDVAIMLSTGWSFRRVLLFQLVSASTAFVGLYIGVPLAQYGEARQWIFAITAGMFLYLALSNVVPELLGYFKVYKALWVGIAAHAGILIGFLIMFLIAIFEDYLVI